MATRRMQPRGKRRAGPFGGLLAPIVALVVLMPAPASAHSDGASCAGGSMGTFPLLLNDGPLLGDYVHCHDSGELDHHDYGYTGAVYVHLPGVAHAGICTNTDLPVPPEARIRPIVGLGDPSEEQMMDHGCEPASNIQVTDFEFDPVSGTHRLGTTLRFKNDGPSQHTSTYVGDLAVWDSGVIEAQVWPEQLVEPFFVEEEERRQDHIFEITLTQAGTYPYRCEIHPEEPDMNATVSIAVAVEPSAGCRPSPCGRGTEHTTFTVGLATHEPPHDIVHDVQVRLNGGEWTDHRFGVRSASIEFQPDAGPGLYDVRARVRRVGAGPPDQQPATLWSPPTPIEVLRTGSTASPDEGSAASAPSVAEPEVTVDVPFVASTAVSGRETRVIGGRSVPAAFLLAARDGAGSGLAATALLTAVAAVTALRRRRLRSAFAAEPARARAPRSSTSGRGRAASAGAS